MREMCLKVQNRYSTNKHNLQALWILQYPSLKNATASAQSCCCSVCIIISVSHLILSLSNTLFHLIDYVLGRIDRLSPYPSYVTLINVLNTVMPIVRSPLKV